MKRLTRLLSLVLASAALAASAGAQSPQPSPPRAAPAEQEGWQRRVREAREVVEQAKARRTAAENAYDEMRHRKYPRGEARVAIEAERSAARDDVTLAQRNLDALLDEARRAGAPPGWLRATEASPASPDVSDTERATPADLSDDAPTADDDTEAAEPSDLPYETPVDGD
jgi:hypothetical protein